MPVIAVCNQKGGVGKTTTTVSLGACAAQGRVLLVDLDPHASLTHALGLEPAGASGGSYALLSQSCTLAEAVTPSAVAQIDVIAAGSALATLERDQGRNPGMGRRLHAILNAQGEAYDWVFIDTPPTLGVLMINALAAACHVVIPTQPDPLARHGVSGMVRTIEMVNRSRPTALGYTVVPTFYDKRTRSSPEGVEALRQTHGPALWSDVIPVDTQFREASASGLPLSQFRSSARGSQAYDRLWADIAARTMPGAAAETSAVKVA